MQQDRGPVPWSPIFGKNVMALVVVKFETFSTSHTPHVLHRTHRTLNKYTGCILTGNDWNRSCFHLSERSIANSLLKTFILQFNEVDLVLSLKIPEVKKVLNETRSHLLSQSKEYEFSSFGRSQGKPNNGATILTPQPGKKKLRPYTFTCDPLPLCDPTRRVQFHAAFCPVFFSGIAWCYSSKRPFISRVRL